MKTYYAKPNEVEREWVLIDATDQVLGRVAAKAAQILKGKHKPQYTPHVDTGDFVIVINADKIRVTGAKAAAKTYYRHSGFPGGLKSETFEQAMARLEEIVKLLEQGEAPLEDALSLFEEGTKLMKKCSAQLDRAEQKVTKLLAGPEGAPVEEPFQGEG